MSLIKFIQGVLVCQSDAIKPGTSAGIVPWIRDKKEFWNVVVFIFFKAWRTSGLTGRVCGIWDNGVTTSGMRGSKLLRRNLCFS